MPLSTMIGRTAADQKAMLKHLITIGTAFNRSSWGDDLQSITGIGTKMAAKLNGLGITTFEELAEADEDELAGKIPAFLRGEIGNWKEAAGSKAAAPERQGADAYLEKVKGVRRFFVGGNGDVERVTIGSDRKSSVSTINIFDAPDGHRPSQELEKALRVLVERSGGLERIPDLDASDVETLQELHDTMDAYGALNDSEIDQLSVVVEPPPLELGPENDLFERYGKLPEAPVYDIPEGHVYGEAKVRPLVPRDPTEASQPEHYTRPPPPVPEAPTEAVKAEAQKKVAIRAARQRRLAVLEEAMLKRGGVRMQGGRVQPPQPHDAPDGVDPDRQVEDPGAAPGGEESDEEEER